MEITRTFENGQTVTITLTRDELARAYREYEIEMDQECCEDYLDMTYWDEAWYKNLSKELREEIVETAADYLRKNLDKYEMSFDYAISDAFDVALRELGISEEEEENND